AARESSDLFVDAPDTVLRQQEIEADAVEPVLWFAPRIFALQTERGIRQLAGRDLVRERGVDFGARHGERTVLRQCHREQAAAIPCERRPWFGGLRQNTRDVIAERWRIEAARRKVIDRSRRIERRRRIRRACGKR